MRVAHNKTHGLSGTPVYLAWCAMRNRCDRAKDKSYAYYGGRGIKVSDRWQSFENFIADMGERPEGMTIERVDSNGNYEPGNCRWASRTEQAHNKRNNVHLTANGKTQTMMEWAHELGVSHTAIVYRLKAGWPVERALTEPAPDRPNGKLTLEQAQWAIDAYPGLSFAKIGARLGVSDTNIINIVKGKTFKNLNRAMQMATA
jgi:hypothetical protein